MDRPLLLLLLCALFVAHGRRRPPRTGGMERSGSGQRLNDHDPAGALAGKGDAACSTA